MLLRGCRESWDKKYVEVEDEVLFHLILAANFLDIKDLLDLTCKTVRAAYLSLFLFPSVDASGAVQGPSERIEETQGEEREGGVLVLTQNIVVCESGRCGLLTYSVQGDHKI